MPAHEYIVDPRQFDLDRVIADIHEIRRWIPQRYAMEQLTAIVYDDVANHVSIGYRDLKDDEFWATGHMPGCPIMPGVMMCEAAAQLLSYHVQRNDLSGVDTVGFGGIDKVRFRGIVRPGDRLVIATQVIRYRRGRVVVSKFQAFVGTNLVCEGELTGIALPTNALQPDAGAA
ncbi:MAG: beta-hydroxyacyl-ACP dehydratase [Planctomycetota bacterium]|nr:MAG: beta-hydroxyacyl-ACP dehydratase [Planctomycetota bacterium]